MAKKPDDGGAQHKPGPKPENLKIDAEWQEAVRKGLKKPRPKKWPDDNEEGQKAPRVIEPIAPSTL